jgi:hypothetical protein
VRRGDFMAFKIKPTAESDPRLNKTLYIKQSLIEKIHKIARENNTSFNHVVISMIENCLEENEE